jgi:anti-anti-sigma factor
MHVVKVARGGEWLVPDEFRQACVEAVAAQFDVVIDLEGIDHLDGSALQILVALGAEQQRNDRRLSLANASPSLLRWFEFAGAGRLFALAPAC